VQLVLENLHAFHSLDPGEAPLDRKGHKHANKQLGNMKSKGGHQIVRMPMKGRWLGVPGSIEDVDHMVR